MPSDQVNRELGALVLRHFPNAREPGQARAHGARRAPAGRGVCLHRPRGGSRRPAGGRVRAGGGAAVGRYRFAGGRLPAAEARLRRGVRALPLGPYLADTSQRKARALVERLVRRQFEARLWLVPFGEIQREVVLAVPAPLRVVVYRRLMTRIAEGIARQTGALALVTGESLGQVASQTLENIARTTEAAGCRSSARSSGRTRRRSSARRGRSGPTRPRSSPIRTAAHSSFPGTPTRVRPPPRSRRPRAGSSGAAGRPGRGRGGRRVVPIPDRGAAGAFGQRLNAHAPKRQPRDRGQEQEGPERATRRASPSAAPSREPARRDRAATEEGLALYYGAACHPRPAHAPRRSSA